MKKISLIGLAASVVLLLSACTLTPMFHIPCDKNTIRADSKTAEPFTGTWECKEKQEKLTVEFHPEKEGNGFLEITLVLTETDRQTQAKLPRRIPMSGIPVRIGGETFLCFMLNPRPLIETGDWSEQIGFMLRPYFYLAKAEVREDDSLKIGLITWIRKVKGPDGKEQTEPTDPAVRLESDSNLVMNSSKELIEMIEAKKYAVTEERIFIRTGGR